MGMYARPTGKEMMRFLEKQGFHLVRIRGSHHVFRKGPLCIPLPVHGNQTLRIGIFRSILRELEMSPEEFLRLWQEE